MAYQMAAREYLPDREVRGGLSTGSVFYWQSLQLAQETSQHRTITEKYSFVWLQFYCSVTLERLLLATFTF